MANRDSNGATASNDPGEAIKVAVRVRKLLKRELSRKEEWKVLGDSCISSSDNSKK